MTWLVRLDDLDAPRVVPGAAEGILRTLERFGLAWDGAVLRQSARAEAYREAFEALGREVRLYRCACSRKAIGEGLGRGLDNTPVYPGTCRALPPESGRRAAWRFPVPDGAMVFDDRVQGRVALDLPREIGDFVVQRADGAPAYHLAAVVDDAFQGVTDVVRGSDLLGSVPRQLLLYRALGLPAPAWAHIPVAVDARGDKLSKQTGARAVDDSLPGEVLWAALRFLGQDPPVELNGGEPREVLAWGVANWRLEAIPRAPSVYPGGPFFKAVRGW